jgi:hypothetical protein
LQIQWNIAHLIQKQSPAMRHFKAAYLLSQGAGKRAPLIAK